MSAANGGPPLVPVSDNAETREALRRALERHFGSFLAHDPHNPEVFWERGVDAVLAALPPVAGPEVRPDETLRADREAARREGMVAAYRDAEAISATRLWSSAETLNWLRARAALASPAPAATEVGEG